MLRIVGCRPGFRKVPHTEYLWKVVGMGLKEAKGITDDVLDGVPRTIACAREDLERHRAALDAMGAIVRVEAAA